ncbi:ABC transporter substrate-binding protein [Sutcliffiella rhizosphaerae]|uniref:Carbohydrate ABC transporter substrate-binding protein n=1 Tax=Sutcliffiella rhizosphaerae TaxID=2880967 RepID=A0ABN8AHZ6_9BACI|nr:extracellular solute-binding protein [Sutcliffiella rhizosphaerae]CAG9622773.1 hypothetical protein BACCIP111883_03564 [Sutcliffiella rhizosphaerae]
MLKKYSFLVILFLLLTACTPETKPVVIATIFPEDFENSIYMNEYNQDVEIRSILSSIDEVDQHWHNLDDVINNYIKENKDVDIVYGFPNYYLQGIVDEGNIKQLNGLLDESILNNIAPAVMTPIKKAGNDNIYGLTPMFQNNVLVYNKDIFEELNMEQPQDSLKWEELLTIANKINNTSEYKGLTLGYATTNSDYFYMIQGLADPIDRIENIGGKAVVNNEVNRKFWKIFADIYKENEKVTTEEFIKGEVAMSIFPIGQLIDTEILKYYSSDVDISKWGIVETPVFEENKGGSAYTDTMFILSSYSKNDNAVKFLEYIHGKEFAVSLVNSEMFPSYWDNEIKSIFMEKYDVDLSAAYMQPGALSSIPPFEGERVREIEAVGAKIFDRYLSGDGNLNDLLIEYEESIN